MILAGDVGGTKTLMGLFTTEPPRPAPVGVRAFATLDFGGLAAIIETFLAAQTERPALVAAAFGVAGPILDQTAQMTNVPWRVEAADLSRAIGITRVRLLNDLEAMAYAVPVLQPHELRTIQGGAGAHLPGAAHAGSTARHAGNMAIIAAGTGLGEAVLHRVGDRYVPLASEGGHTDFAARTERELELVRFLTALYGRAEVEHVVSGPGLLNLADFTHQDGSCERLESSDTPDRAAAVSAAALDNRCPRCVEALDLFVAAYGAAAGNLALTAVTTGGVFIGGGIAPRILPALENGRFVETFNDKGPMRALLEATPVHVVLNAESGLLGAAVYAAGMTE